MSKYKLWEAVRASGYSCYQQGTLMPSNKIPNTFVTYLQIDSEYVANFDNMPAATVWAYQVTLYDIDPASIRNKFDFVSSNLKKSGFFSRGKGRDIPSDLPTHTGITEVFYYLEDEGAI